MNLHNEVIIVLMIVLDLFFVLCMVRFAKAGLTTAVVVNLMLVAIFGAKLISVFGGVTNAGNIFYVAAGTAVAIVTEHHGRKEGYRLILAGFGSMLGFLVLSQLAIQFSGIPEVEAISGAMNSIFHLVPRVALASLVAYAISQYLNVTIFDRLHTIPGLEFLWRRTLIAGSLSQLVDSILFFTIAFAGLYSPAVFFEIMLVGFLVKLVVVVCSVPFLYGSYLIESVTTHDVELHDA
jgi:uncharacterized integral membrane protein (TIGR00697 family)